MALSLSNFLYAWHVLLLLPFAEAATRVYDWEVSWVTRNPDGQYPRPVMGINGEWPLPRLEADVGDRVIVNLKNSLGNASTTIHFHGLYMNGTSHMDGVAQGTQCPVPSGSNFTYDFNITQPGTYWYHSHVDGQYPDGFRGPLIIHDPENPYADQFDEELVLTLSDWYHDEMPGLIKSFLSVGNPTGAEPVPNCALMNDTQNHTISVEPGRTYFLRIINMAAFAAQYFWIEDHTMTIIEVDGVYHEPTEASQLYITAAQRYGVLLTTKNSTDTNFAIVGSMDQDLFDAVPEGLNPNVSSYLLYSADAPLPTAKLIDSFDPFDDMTLVPTDNEALYENPAMSLQLDMKMDNLGDGANYAFFNDITYVRPKVPTTYTVMTSGNLSSDPAIYGSATNTFVLAHNDIVEIVLNNHDPGKHPFHLHGHAFQAIARGADESGDWDPESLANGSLTFPRFPMRRDVLLVRPNGHIVMRFRADNPGVWLFHCHIEWHVDSGLIMTFVEAPSILQQQLLTPGAVPENHFDSCRALDPPMPVAGNAAGNTIDLLDLTGENLPPKPLPAGFTARGIVALVFSCIAGILGVAVVAWYGLGEIGEIARKNEEAKIAKLSAASYGAGNGKGTGVGAGAAVDSDGDHAGNVVRSVLAK